MDHTNADIIDDDRLPNEIQVFLEPVPQQRQVMRLWVPLNVVWEQVQTAEKAHLNRQVSIARTTAICT